MDTVLVNNDHAIFDPVLTGGMIISPIAPGMVKGSGQITAGKQKVCIKGDETSVTVPGCSYIAGGFVIPGTGTFKIKKLAQDQVSKKTKTGNKAILLKGSLFKAEFTVNSPAQQPNPPAPNVPDPQKKYKGTGKFQSFNVVYKTK